MNPDCEERPSTFARPDICLLQFSMAGQSYTRVMDDQNVCELAESVLLKAHNTQILTILRLLGYDSGDTDTDFASHVMQIRTGERMSIILGTCSALFALLKFRVRCVCYSDYLSHRITASRQRPGLRHPRSASSTHDKEGQPGWLQTNGNIRQLVRDLITGKSREQQVSPI